MNIIEKMYKHVKEEIEINTPDGYTSVTNSRRMEQANDGKVGGFDTSKLEGIANKLMGLDGTINGLKERVEVSNRRSHFPWYLANARFWSRVAHMG